MHESQNVSLEYDNKNKQNHFVWSLSQVLRSADRWSTGTCENSILNAYIHTINNSQHYVYIEVVEERHSCFETIN